MSISFLGGFVGRGDRGLPSAAFRGGGGRVVFVGYQGQADFDGLARLAMQRRDRSGARARNIYQCLGRLHLAEDVVLLHAVAHVDAPLDELRLLQTFAEVREAEIVGTRGDSRNHKRSLTRSKSEI